MIESCVDGHGKELACKCTLMVQYYQTKGQQNRKLYCVGVPEKHRHRFHWLTGSVFQGHDRLDARDINGILQAFCMWQGRISHCAGQVLPRNF